VYLPSAVDRKSGDAEDGLALMEQIATTLRQKPSPLRRAPGAYLLVGCRPGGSGRNRLAIHLLRTGSVSWDNVRPAE
jgi:hypothetical protein